MKTLSELPLKGRRVFIRVDFNVPLVGNSTGGYDVGDTTRIEGALPTLRHVIAEGGKCIVASHLGRPNGRVDKKYSLEPVASKLSEYLEKDVILTEDCIGDGPRGLSHQMRAGDVLLLENLRFHPGEEENSIEFANRLLELCDAFVGDAFGTLHRAHASTAALPKLVQDKGTGLLVEKELEFLRPLRDNPSRPFVLVMGGSKVSDKIGILEHFMSKVDTVLVGGAMAYAFLSAKNTAIGKSLCDYKQVKLAEKILKGAEARNIRLLTPLDHVVTKSFGDTKDVRTTESADIGPEWMALDIGPKTVRAFSDSLNGAETIFWNGPMGVFEEPAFSNGTFELARAIGKSGARKLAGGGDVAAAIKASGCESEFDFISTGGGATLEYLEGKELPGLKALEVSQRGG